MRIPLIVLENHVYNYTLLDTLSKCSWVYTWLCFICLYIWLCFGAPMGRDTYRVMFGGFYLVFLL